MPKRNLVILAGILAAAGVTIWVTRGGSQHMGGNGDLEKFRGVAIAMRSILDNAYYIPAAGPDAPNPHEEELAQAMARTMLSRAKGPAPTEDDLLRAMVCGMVMSLGDPYSYYIPPQEVANFERRVMMGKIHGLGICVEMAGDEVRVVGAMIHSPAQRAGIIPGDRILKIDGAAVAGQKIAKVRKLLDEPQGPAVLVLRRPGGQEQTLTIPREQFAIETVEGLYRNEEGAWAHSIDPANHIAYLRIKEFVPETLDSVQRALREMGDIHGLVLDLRGNPGGEFDASLGVADLFLKTGTIVTLHSREPVKKFAAHESGTVADFPVVVLIDDHSASGAEIVAGALSVNDRAVLVGTRSRGKGCMQKMIRLDENLGQINLTTAEYFVGDDQPISHRGVEPHVTVKLPDALREELCRVRLALELSLPRPSTAPAATGPETPSQERADFVLQNDSQLAVALNLLRHPKEMKDILDQARETRAQSHTSPSSTQN